MRLLAALLLPALSIPGWAGPPQRSKVTFPDGTTVLAETARTPEEQAAVLRDRNGVDPEGAILLSYAEAGERVFPAEAVSSTLDLLFLDGKGVVTSAQTYKVLVDCIGEGRHILALAAGSIEKRGLKAGLRVRIGEGAKEKKKPAQATSSPLPLPPREEKGGKKEEPPSAEQVNKDMFESLEQLKGKVPDAMYQSMMRQAGQAAEIMKNDPNADTMDVLKTVTGVDFNKLTRLASDLKAKNPQMTDEEIARRVAAQMMLDMPAPQAPTPEPGRP